MLQSRGVHSLGSFLSIHEQIKAVSEIFQKPPFSVFKMIVINFFKTRNKKLVKGYGNKYSEFSLFK